MNLAEWCIENNRTTIVILVLVVLLGVKSFLSLPRLEDPEFTVRVAMITTYFPGASPLKVEQLVTDKLEKKIRELPQVKRVTSQSLTGVSVIFVEVHDRYTDMKPIWDKLRIKLREAARDLPEGALAPQVDDEFGDVFGIVVALTGDGYTYRELKDVADRVRDELLVMPQVAKVDLYGVQEERVFVEFSNSRLAELGISPAALVNALQSQNIVQPGGNARLGPERVVIEPTGEYKSVEQIRKTSLRRPGTADSVYLEDLARVTRGFVDPPHSLARMNGRPAIILAVSMAKGGKITELGPKVLDKLARITARLPHGLEFEVLAYQPRFVNRAIDDFLVNLLEAFVFVFAVVLFFTGPRTGLVVGMLVPMAMLVCMIFMPAFSVNLEQVSIASLIIALGILVDNGVVVSEDILVRLARGQDRRSACRDAVATLAKPMLAATLTTVFAFLPIATATSDVGEYCFSLFVVITLTLLASWVLSLTMVPLACYYLLKPKPQDQSFSGRAYRLYRRLLLANLRHPWLHLAAVVLLLAAGLYAFSRVPNIFFPPNEREMFYIDVYQPYGTDIRTTARRVARLEKFLLARPEVVNVGTFIGNPGPRWYLGLPMEDQGAHYARLVVNTKTPADVAPAMAAARRFIAGQMPATRAVVAKLETGPPVGAAIQVRISGPEIATLYRLRDQVDKILRTVPGIVNIRDDWGNWTKKLVVEVDQQRAKRAGFTSKDVALSLQTQISGLTATQFREGKEIIPVELRAAKTYREDLGRIAGLNIYSFQDGRSLPLSQIADTRLDWQPSNIHRRDAVRTMTIKTDVEGRFASEAFAEVRAELEKLRHSPAWPAGYQIDYGGEFEESGQAQASIMAGLPLAMGLICFLLVWQFNSIVRPLIIVLTIPPMMIGVAFGLLVTDAPFGFMAMLGLISLTGIIINNAIILIDQIEAEKARGRSPAQAVVLSAQKRLRPIIMTSVTTIVGLIPLSLQGGEMWRPMANTLIFGLGFSTALTLILCPVLYTVFFRLRFQDFRWEAAATVPDQG